MPLYCIRGDLVSMDVDAIVNDSNVSLKMVEGVGRAIFHKAGDLELSKACKKIGFCDLGSAVITPSFNIKNCKAIIHAVGPNYQNGKHGEEKNLRKAYRSALNLAIENNFNSIAFPLLSSEYNYPMTDAYQVATEEIIKFLKTHPNFLVYLVFFKRFPKVLTEEEFNDINKYLTTNFSGEIKEVDFSNTNSFTKTLKELVNEEKLLDLTNSIKCNVTEETYKKLVSDENYNPSKRMIISLGIALELPIKDVEKLLNSCGYTFTYSNVTDLIILYFLSKGIYDLFKINDALFYYEIPTLGEHIVQ